MKYSALPWLRAALLIVATVTAIDISRARRAPPGVFFSTAPVTEDRVRQKMTADGWTSPQITRVADRNIGRSEGSSSIRKPVSGGRGTTHLMIEMQLT
jgi:hypothetical protein